MLFLLSLTAALSPAARELLSVARAGPIYVTSRNDIATLERLAVNVESEAPTDGWQEVAWNTPARWQLLATTRTEGSELLQLMSANPALGEFRLTQRWREDGGETFVDNVVTIARPEVADWRSAWLLLAPGGQSSLVLEHRASVETSPASGRPRVSLELRKAVLDGTRRGSDTVEQIVGVPVPTVPIPDGLLRKALEEAARFEISFQDEELRVTRGVGAEPVLRVFARVEEG